MFIVLPDTVKDVSVWEDSDVEVWSKDVVESPNLLIPETYF